MPKKFDFNEWHRRKVQEESHTGRFFHDLFVIDQIKCADGFKISAQASAIHDCCPRENFAWPYLSVEIWPDGAKGPNTVTVEQLNGMVDEHGGAIN